MLHSKKPIRSEEGRSVATTNKYNRAPTEELRTQSCIREDTESLPCPRFFVVAYVDASRREQRECLDTSLQMLERTNVTSRNSELREYTRPPSPLSPNPLM